MDQRKKRSSVFKRVKERTVRDAVNSVNSWRELFEQGALDENGKLVKLTLQRAAEQVGIPKKTLEDYHQLLRKADEIQPLSEIMDKKMGYIRQMIREKNLKQHQMEVEEYEEPEDEMFTLRAAIPSNEWENMINLNSDDQNKWDDEFEEVIDHEEMNFSFQAYPVLINAAPLEGKLKNIDEWENISIGSEFETDDEDQ